MSEPGQEGPARRGAGVADTDVRGALPATAAVTLRVPFDRGTIVQVLPLGPVVVVEVFAHVGHDRSLSVQLLEDGPKVGWSGEFASER